MSPPPKATVLSSSQRAHTAQRTQEKPASDPEASNVPQRQHTGKQPPQSEDVEDFEAPRLSHVRILPTSLPYVHDQLMEQRDRELRARLEERRREASRTDEERSGSNRQELTLEEQAATVRALKPHSRSIVDLDKLKFEPPIGHPITQQPKKSRKWQFGIRSRNQPYEAMLYLYRAIAAQGGVWDIQPVDSGSDVNTDASNSDSPRPLQSKYPDLPSDYYIPKDPWFIRARLLKEGVKAPGSSTSVYNSRSDLEELRRRFHISGISAPVEDKDKDMKSPTSDNGGISAPSSATQASGLPAISHGVWVFVDIQLYQLEENNYMVDFKCDGYQNVIRPHGDTEWHPISKRYLNKEKEITSPYPFLDVASDLVAQLAVAS